MTSRSFCLIGTETGKDDDIVKYLNEIEGVKACKVDGPIYHCNVIAEISKINMDEVKKTVELQINKKKENGIQNVVNLFVLNDLTKDESKKTEGYIIK
jgi:hypothetical protein